MGEFGFKIILLGGELITGRTKLEPGGIKRPCDFLGTEMMGAVLQNALKNGT